MTPSRAMQRDGFDSKLERTASVLASQGVALPHEDRILDLVNEEIALVLSQLGRLREGKTEALSLMSRLECEVGTDLLGMETPRWWYGPNREERWRDRQGLKARRGQLQMHRLRLEQSLEQDQRALEDRLLTLVQRRLSLEGIEESRQSRRYIAGEGR